MEEQKDPLRCILHVHVTFHIENVFNVRMQNKSQLIIKVVIQTTIVPENGWL